MYRPLRLHARSTPGGAGNSPEIEKNLRYRSFQGFTVERLQAFGEDINWLMILTHIQSLVGELTRGLQPILPRM